MTISRDILEVVLISLLVSFVILFLILVFHKLGTELRDWQKRRHGIRYSTYLRKFLLGRDGTIFVPRGRLAYETLASLCIEKLESSAPEDRSIVQQYIRGARLVEYFQKRARSFSLGKRFHAVKTLGFFSLDELRSYFIDLLEKEKTDEVKGALVWALSRVADEYVLKWIISTLSEDISLSSKFNEYVFCNVIHSFMDKGNKEKFLAFLKKLMGESGVPTILKRDVIEACGTCGLDEAARIIVNFFFSADGQPAMKISSIRALGRLKCDDFTGVVNSALFHCDWRVRSQAALAASACGESAVSHLRNLLYDDYYYVRINAAKSLSKLGEEGLAVLRSEMDSDDPFVRDTVRYMLTE